MSEPYHKFHLDNWTDADFAKHSAATRATIELTLTQKAEIDRLRAKYDEMGVLLADKHNVISALRTELAAKETQHAKRVGELEAALVLVREVNASLDARAEQIELANKEFGDQLAHAHVQLAEERARAERAEARIAELEELRVTETHKWVIAETRAERAEAERDVLHLFSGAQAAVIKEMREALKPFADEYDPDLPFWSCRDDNSMLMWDGLASNLCRGDFIRARAALAPSPVLIDDLGQVWPEDAPARREG